MIQLFTILILLFPLGNILGSFSIQLDSEPNAVHEIEFTSNEKNSTDSEFVTFEGNQFNSDSLLKKFFRVRKVGPYNAKGIWSNYELVDDYSKVKLEPKLEQTIVTPKKSDSAFIELEKNGNKTYFLNGDRVGFEISQSAVGIDQTYYRLNGGDWNKYTPEGLRFILDGEYQMDYYSIDRIGNRETPKTVQFLVDIQPPNTELTIQNPNEIRMPNGFMSGQSKISLLTVDKVSGVETTQYKFVCNSGNETKFQIYNQPFSIEIPIQFCKSGFQIQYFSIDKVGNKEETRTYLFSYSDK
jgi:hypothetical protein